MDKTIKCNCVKTFILKFPSQMGNDSESIRVSLSDPSFDGLSHHKWVCAIRFVTSPRQDEVSKSLTLHCINTFLSKIK